MMRLLIDKGRPLINERSGRAAIKTTAPSMMLDDGSMERRVRLIRPMQRDTMSVEDFATTHWKEADEAEFRAAWDKEVVAIPEHSTSTFHLVTGLLLPIWRRLPQAKSQVYRLQTDDGERIIGRLLGQVEMEAFCRNIGMDAPKLSAEDAWALIHDGKATAHLADGLVLRRVRVMNENRDGADRLHLRHGRGPEGPRPVRRNHLLETALVRARRRSRQDHLRGTHRPLAPH